MPWRNRKKTWGSIWKTTPNRQQDPPHFHPPLTLQTPFPLHLPLPPLHPRIPFQLLRTIPANENPQTSPTEIGNAPTNADGSPRKAPPTHAPRHAHYPKFFLMEQRLKSTTTLRILMRLGEHILENPERKRSGDLEWRYRRNTPSRSLWRLVLSTSNGMEGASKSWLKFYKTF